MPNWKKVIVSGSDASLNTLSVVNGAHITGSLNVYKSGSTVFSIDGSQGRLFEITDQLSGSLFAVSDISGVPSFEVFSDDTVKIGSFNSEAIIVEGSTLKLSQLSNQSSEATAVVINGSNVVGTRELGSNAFNSTTIPTNNNQLTNGAGYITGLNWSELGGAQSDINISGFTNDAGYTTNVGDITGVTAGTGISGGGTSGTVTITNSDRGSSQNIFKNVAVSGQTSIVADSNNDTLTFAAGAGIGLTTNASTDTITITNSITNNNQLTNGAGYITDGNTGWNNTYGFITGVDWGEIGGTQSDVNISGFTNDSGFTSNTGTVTSVASGTGLTGGTITTSGTLSLATAGVGAGTYGSTANGTKIDTITVDAYGRITAVATGATGTSTTSGTVTSVATGTGLTGGTITSTGTISLSHLGFQNLTDPNDDRIAFWDDSAGSFAWLDIGSGLSISGTTLSNTITNNNQLTNGAGYITDGNTNWNNTYGFITGVDWADIGGTQSDVNISGFTNDAGYTSNVGDITGVTAGNGLTGGGTSGAVTLNVGAGTGVTVNADNIEIGQAVGPSDDVEFNSVTIAGDLTVNGTTTTISTTNTAISDNLIELNSGAASNSNDSGIIIERGTTGDNALFIWDESADRFAVGTTTATAGSTGNITFSTANLQANTFVGALSGNATTATSAGKWSTARTLTLGGDLSGNVTFDGSGNFTLSAQVSNDSHTHDGRYYTESEVDTLLLAKDNYGSWTVSDGTNATDINSGGTLTFSAGSNVSIGESAGIVTISATNTTYSAGNGIGLSGTTFSVAAGTGLTQDASGLSLATAGAGAGTYGSTANGTKIDTITIDAYGRVTAVATGATGTSSTSGTVTSVATGTGLTGGTITSTGTISLSHLGLESLTDPNDDRIFFWDDSAGAAKWLDIGAGLSISGTTLSNTITNNNQLTNGAGYITDGNTNWNNSYGFITATSTDTLSNKSGNISQWTNDSGYLTSETYTGTVTSVGVSAGTGLSGGGTVTTSGTISLAVDLSELTDMTAAMVGTDEFIVLDAGADRRKAANEIPLSIFNNDSGFTSNVGDITDVRLNTDAGYAQDSSGIASLTIAGGAGITTAGSGTTVTISNTITNNNQLTNGAGYITATSTDTLSNKSGNISQWTNDAGYTTNVGDITGVTAGTGLSGGGSSGTVTLNLDFSELTDMTGDIAGTTEFILQNGTVESRKAASEIKLSQFNNDSGWTSNVGDITGVTAGSGLTGGGTSGTVTVSHADTSAQASVNNSGNTVIQDVTLDTYGHVTSLTSKTLSLGGLGYTGATNADLYDYWTIDVQGQQSSISSTDTLTIQGTGATTTTYDPVLKSLTIDSSDTNTTYSAGAGLNLSGTSFSVEPDLRDGITHIGLDATDYISFTNNTRIDFFVNNGNRMQLQSNGDLHVDADVIAYSATISDKRLKDNVTTIENPLDKIKALRGVEYDWNVGSRKGQHDLGLIAQEVEEVIPDIVREHELPLVDGTEEGMVYKTVDYEKMVAVLIEGMKEQQSQIEELKSEINKLKGN